MHDCLEKVIEYEQAKCRNNNLRPGQSGQAGAHDASVEEEPPQESGGVEPTPKPAAASRKRTKQQALRATGRRPPAKKKQTQKKQRSNKRQKSSTDRIREMATEDKSPPQLKTVVPLPGSVSPAKWAGGKYTPKFGAGDFVKAKAGQDHETGAIQQFVSYEPAKVQRYEAALGMYVLIFDDETDREQYCPRTKVKAV